MTMRQEEIVKEINQMCGKALRMPSLGWHFKYNNQVYCYVVGNDQGMIRFCIPFVAGISSHDKETLYKAVNDTNRNVKFIKALLSEKDDCKVSLDYDHKINNKDTANNIVPHIIMALDYAVKYLMKKLKG